MNNSYKLKCINKVTFFPIHIKINSRSLMNKTSILHG